MLPNAEVFLGGVACGEGEEESAKHLFGNLFTKSEAYFTAHAHMHKTYDHHSS